MLSIGARSFHFPELVPDVTSKLVIARHPEGVRSRQFGGVNATKHHHKEGRRVK